MAYRSLIHRLNLDPEMPARCQKLMGFGRVLDGTLYDCLQYDFHQERNQAEYIPLRERRPSVRTNLCAVVVDDAASLLFSESHFPAIDSSDPALNEKLELLAKHTRLNEVMSDAAHRGSVGSVALWFRVMKGKPHFKALSTAFLTPEWDPEDPTDLLMVTEKYKVNGQELLDSGYTEADGYPKYEPVLDYWFMRTWDRSEEVWYIPWRIQPSARTRQPSSGAFFPPKPPERELDMGGSINPPPKEPTRDLSKTRRHGLGFCPMVWVRNLPGGDDTDGLCTFERAIDTVIELDYLESQGSRGLKYSMDPTLMIKDPAGPSGDMVKGPTNAILVDAEGDAKLLEISGGASAAVVDYGKELRERALEAMHGNRANADRITAAQSGRATELLYQPLIWLADRMRISYGEHGLLELMRLVVRASQVLEIEVAGQKVGKLADVEISLKWPNWFPPSGQDELNQSTALVASVGGGIMSKETAVKRLSANYDVEDITEELSKIEKEDQQRQQAELALKSAKPPQSKE